jgi:hypothetical protein
VAPEGKDSGSVATELARIVAGLAERLGVDGALYLVIAVGGFGALWLQAPADAVVKLALIIVGGRVFTKLINAYVLRRHEEHEWRKLRATKGVALVERHRDRQGQLPLQPEGDDDNGSR